MTIGRVLEPGPATNCDITTSSHDSVNDNSQPESSAGADAAGHGHVEATTAPPLPPF
jgi:hypothetical protein